MTESSMEVYCILIAGKTAKIKLEKGVKIEGETVSTLLITLTPA